MLISRSVNIPKIKEMIVYSLLGINARASSILKFNSVLDGIVDSNSKGQ